MVFILHILTNNHGIGITWTLKWKPYMCLIFITWNRAISFGYVRNGSHYWRDIRLNRSNQPSLKEIFVIGFPPSFNASLHISDVNNQNMNYQQLESFSLFVAEGINIAHWIRNKPTNIATSAWNRWYSQDSQNPTNDEKRCFLMESTQPSSTCNVYYVAKQEWNVQVFHTAETEEEEIMQG